MNAREQREQEQQCAAELREAIKQVIDGSECTYRDVVRTLRELADFYKAESGSRKVRQ